jgi:nucleoside-diphosphate-sugar epimerase
MFRTKCLLLIGGSGQLGKEVVTKFRTGLFRKWRVFNIDQVENPEATENFIIDPTKPITPATIVELKEKLTKFDEEFEAMINCAGLWYPPNDQKLLKKLYKSEEDV